MGIVGFRLRHRSSDRRAKFIELTLTHQVATRSVGPTATCGFCQCRRCGFETIGRRTSNSEGRALGAPVVGLAVRQLDDPAVPTGPVIG